MLSNSVVLHTRQQANSATPAGGYPDKFSGVGSYDPEEFVAEHQEIFDAVKEGDVEAAVENLIANLRTTERLLAGTYESVPNRVD